MLSCSKKSCKHVTHLKPPRWTQVSKRLRKRSSKSIWSSVCHHLCPKSARKLGAKSHRFRCRCHPSKFLGSRLQRKHRKMRKHHGGVLQQWSSWKKRGIHLACPDPISKAGASNLGKTCSHHTIKLKASSCARHEQMHHNCTMIYNTPYTSQTDPAAPHPALRPIRASRYRVFHGTPHTQSTWVSWSKRLYIYKFNCSRGSSLARNPQFMLVLMGTW